MCPACSRRTATTFIKPARLLLCGSCSGHMAAKISDGSDGWGALKCLKPITDG